MKEAIMEILKKLADIDEFNESDSLNSIGIDSLKTVELILLIEEEFSIEIPDEDLSADNFLNCVSLVEMVKTLKAS